MARMPRRSDLDTAVDVGVNLAKAQVKAITALPGAIAAVAEAANNINRTAEEARAVIRKAQAVADRLDGMLDHVEPAVSEITPTLQALKEAQQRIVAMTGSTEKLASFVDDAGAGLSKLAGLSGASGLFNRLAAAAKPTEPLVRGSVRGLASVPAEPAAEILPPQTPTEDELAELVGADVEPVAFDESGIEDAELVDDDVLEDQALEDQELADELAVEVNEDVIDEALRPVELGSEADGDDVADITDEPATG
jgi:ABC-type transporter Mla subunit MlaD